MTRPNFECGGGLPEQVSRRVSPESTRTQPRSQGQEGLWLLELACALVWPGR